MTTAMQRNEPTLKWCHHCGKWGSHDTKACPKEPMPTLFDQPDSPPQRKEK